MKRKILFFLCLFLILFVFKYPRAVISCTSYALYKNLTTKTNISGFNVNKPFYLIFDHPIHKKNHSILNGFNYWNGYSVKIVQFHKPKKAQKFFLKHKQILKEFSKEKGDLAKVVINDSCFVKGYYDRNIFYSVELFALHNNKFIWLTQITNQIKYRNIETAKSLLNSIIL